MVCWCDTVVYLVSDDRAALGLQKAVCIGKPSVDPLLLRLACPQSAASPGPGRWWDLRPGAVADTRHGGHHLCYFLALFHVKDIEEFAAFPLFV